MKDKNRLGNPSDTDRLKIMITEFFDSLEKQKDIAIQLDVNPKTFNTWLMEIKEEDTHIRVRKIQKKHKRQISQALGLDYSIWEDSFSSISDFCQKLVNYKKINMCEDNVLSSVIKVLELESEDAEIQKRLYEEAIQEEKEGNIVESLEKIELILATKSSFLLSNANKIKFFYAKLLGSKTIQNFTKAIDILNKLCENKYYLEEPEVLTLLFSNSKRKNLYCDDGVNFKAKEDINFEQIEDICQAYKEIFEIGSVQTQYYDALNYVYMHNIHSYLTVETLDTIRVLEVYKNLKVSWKVDGKNWWEVISQAEFLMLIGDVSSANIIVDNFLEAYQVTENQKSATIRQLELYIHFTQDDNAIEFYKHLEESLYYRSL